MVFKHALSIKGFTLLEVIVSIFILGILATIMVVQLNNEDPVAELDRNARATVNVLQLARSYAMSGYQNIDSYGVYMYSNRQYLIYADSNGNQRRDTGEEIINYYLDENISFDGIRDICFSQIGSAEASNTAIILQSTDTETEITITIEESTGGIFYE
jgi:prepilin-type N-terminal cleavage/methylation domain-containing protein